MPIDKDQAKLTLQGLLAEVEAGILRGQPFESAVEAQLDSDLGSLFKARSQSYREALLGCAIARLQDQSIDVRHPYVGQGPNSISLRMFDQDVVNPFLKDAHIPSSKGPYLAMFRRGWNFTRQYKAAVQEKNAHAAFLNCMDYLESLSTPKELRLFVRELIHRFWKLREDAAVPIVQIRRLSLPQCDVLISGLLSVQSGGRLPVLITHAMFETIKRHFDLDWTVECQGINVADAASGAGGDITIKSGGRIVMAAEVTERLVDRNRLVSTFKSKIAPAGIEDYLFFTKRAAPDPDAQRLAEQYFCNGSV